MDGTSTLRTATTRADHPRTASRREAPKVLLIEDHAALRESITFSLEQNGCEVVSANCGVRGFLEFLRCMPDVVVLDVQLPDMDGLQVLGEIRERCLEIPVVVMTDADAPVHSAVPSVTVLRKPFTPKEFLATLSKVLVDHPDLGRPLPGRPKLVI